MHMQYRGDVDLMKYLVYESKSLEKDLFFVRSTMFLIYWRFGFLIGAFLLHLSMTFSVIYKLLIQVVILNS